jgi:structural maintenance of chromosome 2
VRSALLATVQELKDKVRILSGQLANVHFSYHDPVKNFDRSKVKGVLAKLVQVKDSSTATALEVVSPPNTYIPFSY